MGAECSLVTETIFKQLDCHLEAAFLTLNGIGGATVFANNKTTLNVEKDGTAFEIEYKTGLYLATRFTKTQRDSNPC